ncbi:hypothetical protein FGIG_10356 [Fasciola gigantica]|uniref:CUB domain-containing protein n=1 Tax=Fasciola gigantica TaxID=46835 RepID=A0A504YFV2_FASGI|nr:hypothetical protein FGIG_10356 [Fasciola gigantica]
MNDDDDDDEDDDDDLDSPTTQDCSNPISVLPFVKITWPPLDKTLPSDLYKSATNCSSRGQTNRVKVYHIPVGPLICQPELQATAAGNEVNIPGNDYFIPTGYSCTQVIKASAKKSIQLLFHDFQLKRRDRCINVSQYTYRATRIPNTLQIPSVDTVLPNNFSCDYVIEAQIGKQVHWNFTKFKLGKTATDCSKQQVLISTSLDTDRPMIFCGPDLPRNYTNLTTRLVVKVTGSEFSPDDGFTLEYSSGQGLRTVLLTLRGGGGGDKIQLNKSKDHEMWSSQKADQREMAESECFNPDSHRSTTTGVPALVHTRIRPVRKSGLT